MYSIFDIGRLEFMTFKAKSAAVMLVALVLVHGWYFAQVLPATSETPGDDIAYRPLLS
jgi:hypothetical protein